MRWTRAGRRWLIVALAMCMLATACSRSADAPPEASGGQYGSGVDLTGLDDPEGSGAPTATAGGGSGSSGSAGDTPSATQPPQRRSGQGGLVTLARDNGATGQNALAYLRSSHPKLILEINAVEGKAPPKAVVDLLKQRLSEIVDKPQGIEVIQGTIPARATEYTMDEVKAIEQQYRRTSSDVQGPKVVMHLLYLNGLIKDNPDVLGVAYGASSTVMLPDRFAAAANPVITADKIGRAVLIHEVGHILGLVNIGYRSPRDHEDPEHKGHSKNPGSVMYWAVESLRVASVLQGDVPTTFDADDKADLADRKAGKI